MHKTKEGGAVENTGEVWVVYVQITNSHWKATVA